jgi:hypothetical protein
MAEGVGTGQHQAEVRRAGQVAAGMLGVACPGQRRRDDGRVGVGGLDIEHGGVDQVPVRSSGDRLAGRQGASLVVATFIEQFDRTYCGGAACRHTRHGMRLTVTGHGSTSSRTGP